MFNKYTNGPKTWSIFFCSFFLAVFANFIAIYEDVRWAVSLLGEKRRSTLNSFCFKSNNLLE
ncbi:MAG: hypothetical protein K6T88_20400, partial [Bacillus sp. (in: Bacteria)]|nr:hypothetical protein [Bacillus sp. (in: firmicutes)]